MTDDEGWNAAAICQALGCPGCCDCRDDDSDATWDGKDDGHFWACPKPSNDPAHNVPHDQPGDCRLHEIPFSEYDANGHEVA